VVRGWARSQTAEVWGGLPVAKCVVGNLSQTETFEEPAVQDQFDITLEDSDLLGEVELTTDLIIAATESNLPLSTAEIDRLLGVAQGVEN
jgi:hypothetical protein